MNSTRHSVECFRPLSGSYISQYRERNTNAMVKRVSVPYRGATFLNDYADTKYKDGMKVVFVPYRGATFLNEIVP